MKKIYLSIVIALCAILQLAAQTKVIATKSGYINNTSALSSKLNEGALVVKGFSATYARKSFIEVPVGTVEASSVEFNVNFQKSDKQSGNDVALVFSTKNGAIPSDITFANQTDLTEVESTTVNSNNFGWVTVDITASYNAAVAASETAMMIQMSSKNEETEMLTFYHLGTANSPYIMLLEAGNEPCEPEYNTTNCILTEGEEIVVGETTITESGSYIIAGTTECGAEKIDTVNVLFITEGEVETDYTVCVGDELPIQIGATEYKTYTEAGTYTDVITSTDGKTTQTTITNLTISDEPTTSELSDESFVEGKSATFDAGEGAATYQWYLNGAAIANATEQTFTISDDTDAILVGDNTLYVEVTNEIGCVGSSNTATVSYLTTTAQTVELPVARTGFVQIGTTNFNEAGLQVRGTTAHTSYVRISYIEVAVGTEAASEVLLNVCFTKSLPVSTTIYPMQFATKSGAIPSDIAYTNQPDGFVETENTTIDGALTDSWITTDITASYNAAVEASETAMMVRMISDQNTGLLYFYHLATANEPFISLTIPAMVAPIEPVVLEDASIAQGTPTTLDAGAGFASYQWYLNDAAIEGATEQTLTISTETAGVKNGDNTVYVVVANEYGMTATSNTATITYDTTTAIAETTCVEVRLAPNPVRDRLYIDSNKAFDNVAIYDVVGKLVLSAQVASNSIDMSGLSAGIYVVSLSNDTEPVTRMVTKK